MSYDESEILAMFDFKTEFWWLKPLLIGYHELPGDRRAKIRMLESNYAGRYDMFAVTIINKYDGAIDHMAFNFRAFFPARGPVYLWQTDVDRRYYWSTDRPESTLPLTAAIDKWIDMYR